MTADKNELLTILASKYVYKPENLKKHISSVVYDIFQYQWERMDKFIDTLLLIESVRDEYRVVYIYEECGREGFCNAVDVMDVEDDLDMAGYSLRFPEWKYSLGYLVADNDKTQKNITEVLVEYLKQASKDGFDEKEREEKLQKVAKEFDEMEPLSDEVVHAPEKRKKNLEPNLLKAVEAIEKLNAYNRRKEREKILPVNALPGRVRDESIRNNLHVLR